jgi:hypothetical protein
MTSTIEQFGYRVRGSVNAEAHIVLTNFTKLNDGSIAITAGMTALEIDTNVQLLKDDLDRVGRLAKAAVLKVKSKPKDRETVDGQS